VSATGGPPTPLKAIPAFVAELGDFAHELSGLDHVWRVLFPDAAGRWHHVYVSRYQDTHYITHIDGGSDAAGLAVGPDDAVRALSGLGGVSDRLLRDDEPAAWAWAPLIVDARAWLGQVRRDWVRANKRVQLEYPLRYRHGIVPHALVRASLPGFFRLDEALGSAATRQFVQLVEGGHFLRMENTTRDVMTAGDYFEYCRIAYLAGRQDDEVVDDVLSGREMYRRFADGRHEGLLDIDLGSPQAFADWLDGRHPLRTRGGHPWEIKRGGNTTHIDLAVSRSDGHGRSGYRVELRGESIGRMVETLRMFLALDAAGYPIGIADPEGVRRRLLAQDSLGIIPAYATPHRGHQHFRRDQDVFDVIYYDDLGRYKRRITPFITWEPLPVLVPHGV